MVEDGERGQLSLGNSQPQIETGVRLPGPRDLFRRAWASSRPLTFVGASMMLVLVAGLIGLLVDPRVITGAPAWLKPMKFAVSISIYCFTLLWMLSFVPGRPRLVVLLAWQALRGQPVISPDARTLGALLALIVTTGTVSFAVVMGAYRGRL